VLQPPIIVANIAVRIAAVEVCHSASLTILTRPFSSAVIMPPNARQKAAPTARLSDTSMDGFYARDLTFAAVWIVTDDADLRIGTD
jgi:hypothetical protein